MALTTSAITGRCPFPDDTVPATASLRFVLSGVDVAGADVLHPAERIVELVSGVIPSGFDLWRNSEGERLTRYDVYLTVTFSDDFGVMTKNREYPLGHIQVGSAASYALADLLVIPTVGLSVEDYIGQIMSAAATAATDADRAEAAVVDAAAVAADRVAAEAALEGTILAAASVGLFADTTLAAAKTAGLAVTTEGQTFHATGADVDYVGVYKDVSGVAVEQARYPRAEAVEALQDKTDSSAPWYFGAKQVVSGVEDGGARIVSALYIDGSQDDYFAVTTSDVDDQWYAGYEQVWYGVAAPDGGIASADLLGGGSFETFMATADPMGIADTIVIIGDSLTQNTTYETALATKTGRRIINLGRGSQQSKHIAARMGAISVTMAVSGNQIVSGANTITHINGQAIAGGLGNQTTGNQFLSRADSNTTDSVSGWLGSVRGTLTRTASGGPPSTTEAYTFVPDAGQMLPAKCPAGTPWVTDYSAYRDLTHVIWAGSNDIGWGDDLARVQAMLPAMIDSLGHGRWIVLNPINRTGDAAYIEGATYWLTTFAIEQYLAGLSRKNFVNIRRMMIDQGLSRAGITASGTDTTDIAADTIATSLKADAIHHNTAGNEVIAEIVAEQINARGY